jgi:predicted MFS family arabinose efflux permease
VLRLTRGVDAPGRARLPPRGRAIVAALAVTQTVGYGSLWYSFPVLLGPTGTDLGVSRTTVTGAFTAAVLASAALAVPVGRWLDRHGARGLMTLGSVVGTALLVALSRADSVTELYAVWAGIGAVGAAVFYEAAFATAVAWAPPALRARTILSITVVAGFASTVFIPLTGRLVEAYGWRTAVLVLAVVHGVVTVPLHALVLRRPPHVDAARADAAARAGAEAARRAAVVRAVHDGRFWLLGLGFTAQTVAFATMSVHLVGILVAAGHPPTVAAAVAGTIGALQVLGRVVVTGLSRRFGMAAVVGCVYVVQAAAAAALSRTAASTVGAVAAVAVFGFGFGLGSIARPALLTALFGTTGFASLSGRLAVPVTLMTAGAPLAAAGLQHATGSWTPVLLGVAGSTLLAAAAIVLAGLRPPAAPGDGLPAQA